MYSERKVQGRRPHPRTAASIPSLAQNFNMSNITNFYRTLHQRIVSRSLSSSAHSTAMNTMFSSITRLARPVLTKSLAQSPRYVHHNASIELSLTSLGHSQLSSLYALH
jgi:hypothetical protein